MTARAGFRDPTCHRRIWFRLGRTNLQLAESLTLGVRAVENHLSRIFAKLGVTSRTAVTASLQLD
ncbi:LuxR C-terminal-related transcriptional regulator [Spirillospora sp. CA-294931]|uniref:LuxR C-terminal-related transcriptional regulator n=1 Tax=Spirillospora sp. CA-294931 TaxID=3240042 RepID=UPI003D949F9A